MSPKDLTNSRILIVEDSEANMRVLTRLLDNAGYQEVTCLTDSRKALGSFLSLQPDLVLLDLHMPHQDGFQILSALGPHVPEGGFLPILVITGDQDPAVKIRCLESGAKDFVGKPFKGQEVLLRIKNLLETRSLHRLLESRNNSLSHDLEEKASEIDATQLEVLHRLAAAAEFRDDVTGRHAERVGVIAGLIAGELGKPAEEVELIRIAAQLHDVGKIGIPDSILLKPGPLTESEFETIKTHTTIGGLILSKGSYPLLEYARDIALTHHERWDGTGYPKGLAAHEIPEWGRIVSIADVFDVITHERQYKRASPEGEALETMREQVGTSFDPDLFEIFLDLVQGGRISQVLSEIPEGGLIKAGLVRDSFEVIDLIGAGHEAGAEAGWSDR